MQIRHMQELTRGYLLSVEGIDGSGKSTLCKNLYKLLSERYPTLLTKEPGDTPLGQQLRTIVQEKKVPICAKAEYLLFATDRAQHFDQCILPALAEKKIVLSDRLADSSLVYQGYGRDLDTDMIETINTWAMNRRLPDLTLYVAITQEEAIKRIKKRNLALTSFEKEKEEFVEKLLDGFDAIFASRDNVVYLDGMLSPETLAHEAFDSIVNFIEHKRLL